MPRVCRPLIVPNSLTRGQRVADEDDRRFESLDRIQPTSPQLCDQSPVGQVDRVRGADRRGRNRRVWIRDGYQQTVIEADDRADVASMWMTERSFFVGSFEYTTDASTKAAVV